MCFYGNYGKIKKKYNRKKSFVWYGNVCSVVQCTKRNKFSYCFCWPLCSVPISYSLPYMELIFLFFIMQRREDKRKLYEQSPLKHCSLKLLYFYAVLFKSVLEKKFLIASLLNKVFDFVQHCSSRFRFEFMCKSLMFHYIASTSTYYYDYYVSNGCRINNR